MKEFTDVTSTTFGLIIAYVLPGLFGLFGMSFFSPRIASCFETIMSADSSAALILVMLLAAIAVGLQLSVARFLVFECLICRDCRFDAGPLGKIAEAGKLPAFRLLIDEQYRYHQFWGAMSFTQPILLYDWISALHGWNSILWAIGFGLIVEGATVYAGIESLRRYTCAQKRILGET